MLWRILSEGDEDLGTWEGESPAEAHDAFARSTGETSGRAQAKAIGLEYGTLLATITIRPVNASEAPLYRTDDGGERLTLRDLTWGNQSSPDTIEDIYELRVGESTVGIVSVTRIS